MPKPKHHSLIQEGGFQEYGTAKIDAKHRLLLKGPVEEHYRIYRNDAGQILLAPQVMIPAREAWLFKNKKAIASVQRGLKQLGEKKFIKMPSLAAHAKDEIG